MDIQNKKYAFVLGSNPALSTAEIFSVFSGEKNIEVVSLSEEVLIIQSPSLDDGLIDRLGGTIKIIEISREINIDEYSSDVAVKNLAKLILDTANQNQRKFHFGVSVYRLDAPEKMIGKLAKSLKYICVNLKKNLKEENIGLAFINIKERSLSSASVIKNKLNRAGGMEGILVASKTGILLGKTIAVQNIDLYTQLDVGRPVRDIVSGTTPPKLAKIMINLAGERSDASMLDPFCGSGTFLQEMILLGYKNIIGTDISEKAVSDTKKNLDWLKERFKTQETKYDVYQSDVVSLEEHIKPDTIDAVVSEGYLGPALRAPLRADQSDELISKLNIFYKKVFGVLVKLLKKDGVIVFALPIFRTEGGLQTPPILADLSQFELKIVNPLDGIKNSFDKFSSGRNSIIYSRPDQFVLREIIVLRKEDVPAV